MNNSNELRETGFCAKSGLYCFACGKPKEFNTHSEEILEKKRTHPDLGYGSEYHNFVSCFAAPDVQEKFSQVREKLSKVGGGWDSCDKCRKIVLDKKALQTDIYIAHAKHLIEEKNAEIQRLSKSLREAEKLLIQSAIVEKSLQERKVKLPFYTNHNLWVTVGMLLSMVVLKVLGAF